jgi:glycosyltransferase involved in cell wall biosynthesis
MNPGTRNPLVVVTPVFEDSEASARLFRELRSVLDDLRLVVVDDGSVRAPVEALALRAAGVDGTIVRLKRNVGHQRAIAIGLNFAAEHYGRNARGYVVMDSDGEDLPTSIPELVAALRESGSDVVVAKRRNRVESPGFRAFYASYKWLFKLATGRAISFGNFMALTPAALDRLAAMQELWIHVAGCVLASKLRVDMRPTDRGPRYAGSSKMNFVSLALHGFRALMVFAEDVLVRVGIACAIVAGLSVVGMSAAVVLKVIGFATPGWFSVALGIMLLIFMQTGTLVLVSLMLTGVVRSGSIALLDWRDFVASTESVEGSRRAEAVAGGA